MELTKAYIDTLATNTAAIKNAEKLANTSSFVTLGMSQDETLLYGECKGSGKNNYVVSVDFIEAANPIARCTCPSRQIPCKHALGLLYAYAKQLPFGSIEIPADVTDKRAKLEGRAEKKAAALTTAKEKKPTSPKAKNTALIKKINSQLEGLESAKTILNQITNAGLGALDQTAKKGYMVQIKNLGNYYIGGVQAAFVALFALLDEMSQDHYTPVIQQINVCHQLIKNGTAYLEKKKEDPDANMDISTPMEELLGYAWKLEELIQKGCYVENASLIQLSFYSFEDASLDAYVDEGLVLLLNNGLLYRTLNYRPYKAAKHIKEEDSIFRLIQTETAVLYPGDVNPRIRYQSFTLGSTPESHLTQVHQSAKTDYKELIKTLKNSLKSPLSDQNPAALIQVTRVEKVADQNQYMVYDAQGQSLLLGDIARYEESFEPLFSETIPKCQTPFTLLVRFENQIQDGLLVGRPLTIITDSDIIRLLY